MLAPAHIWGDDMKLKIPDKVTDAYHGARERLVVVGQRPVSLKISVIGLLIAFVCGFLLSWQWDLSGFREFRAKAAVLQQTQDRENARLLVQLNIMRGALSLRESKQGKSDKTFKKLIDKEGPVHCLVPVEDLNPIIKEAGE